MAELTNRQRKDVETTLKEVEFLEELAAKLGGQLAVRLGDEQLDLHIFDRATSQDNAYNAAECTTVADALRDILENNKTREDISY